MHARETRTSEDGEQREPETDCSTSQCYVGPWTIVVKTCVVEYSVHVIPCFSLTPTAIYYREPNVLATMQQPSSVVHSKLQYIQYLNTQGKQQVFST